MENKVSTEDVRVEALAEKLHEIYQQEAHRQGDVRHKDDYADLPDNIKEFDRVLARYILHEDARSRREAYAAGLSASGAQPNGDINPCTGDQDCKHVCPAPASGAQRVTADMLRQIEWKTDSPTEAAAALNSLMRAAPAGHALSEPQVRNALVQSGVNDWSTQDITDHLNALLRASQAGSQSAQPKPENLKWLLDASNQVISELGKQEHLDSDTFRWLCNAVGQVERDLRQAVGLQVKYYRW